MEKTIKALIIDDDQKLNALLRDYFQKFSIEAASFTDPLSAIQELKTRNYDCIILDIMMPEMDGFMVLKEIRSFSTTPIIMLTARGELSDRVLGLELGADDYLAKPFEPRELVARLVSLKRRNSLQNKENSGNEIQIRNLKLNPSSHQVTLHQKKLDLSPIEFSLLHLFMQNPDRVLSRDFILDRLKGEDWLEFDRSVDMMISRLRNRLGDSHHNSEYIKTIRGSGYLFIKD